MIDDNIMIGRRRRRRRAAPGDLPGGRIAEVVSGSLAAYASAGLTPKPAKTTLHASAIDGLGATIDGRAGWVAAKTEHIVVAFATLGAAVEARGATHSSAALGTALLTHVLLMRRDALCLVDRLFVWVQQLEKGGGRFGRMSDAVADEILVLGALAPVLGTDLRVRSHPELFCSDARGGSAPWGGVCRASIPERTSRELWRLRVRRGGAAVLDHRALVELNELRKRFADEGVPGDLVDEAVLMPFESDTDVNATRTWVREVVRALDWRRGAFGFRLPAEHVNLSEYRAVRVVARRLIKEGITSSRVVVCTDSNVVLGASAKGRSRSAKLRRLQQGMVAQLLFYNLYLGVLPIGTHDNPADDPSRGTPVRPPAAEPSAWAEAFVGGDVEAIDPLLAAPRHERWLVPDGHPRGTASSRDWALSHAEWHARPSSAVSGRPPRCSLARP